MRLLRAIILVLLSAVAAHAQPVRINPYSLAAPLVVFPTSAVNGGGSSPVTLIAPEFCMDAANQDVYWARTGANAQAWYNGATNCAGGNVLMYANVKTVGVAAVSRPRISFFDTVSTTGEWISVNPLIDYTLSEDTFGLRINTHSKVSSTSWKIGGAVCEVFDDPGDADTATGLFSGCYGFVHHQGTQNWSRGFGMYSVVDNTGSGDMDRAAGFVAQGGISGTGSVNVRYSGFEIDSVTDTGGGHITELDGVYIPTLSAGTTNWGLNIVTNKSRLFGGVTFNDDVLLKSDGAGGLAVKNIADAAAAPITVSAITANAVNITNAVVGVAGSYKLARGTTAFDGSNPTTVATGLTTVVSCTATVLRTTALSTGTAFVTHATASGANVDFYAWLIAGTASTGTETFEWICVGT